MIVVMLLLKQRVKINGSGYNIFGNGSLSALGNSSDSINITIDELHTSNSNIVNTNINCEKFYLGEFYIEEFNECNQLPTGWSGSIDNNTSGMYSTCGLYMYEHDGDQEVITKTFTLSKMNANISFDFYNRNNVNTHWGVIMLEQDSIFRK